MEVTDTTCDSMTLSPVGLAMAVASYRQLIAWQKGISLVTDLYRLTNSFPRDEIYRLTSQMRRAAVSIPANIAEGQGRLSTGEFKQFLGHARGSMFELESHTVIAHNLGYLTQEDSGKVVERIHELGRLVNGLLKSLDRTAS
jgi:four helix bundle protein